MWWCCNVKEKTRLYAGEYGNAKSRETRTNEMRRRIDTLNDGAVMSDVVSVNVKRKKKPVDYTTVGAIV